MKKIHYVYELLDEHGKTFYVGKGSGGRAWKHTQLCEAHGNSERAQKIKAILERGGTVTPRIILQTADVRLAHETEKDIIRRRGELADLANISKGSVEPFGGRRYRLIIETADALAGIQARITDPQLCAEITEIESKLRAFCSAGPNHMGRPRSATGDPRRVHDLKTKGMKNTAIAKTLVISVDSVRRALARITAAK